MKIRIRYWKGADEYEEIFESIDDGFLGGVAAVPYLFFPLSAQRFVKIECFYNETWQTYGNYDIIRTYIFPFIDPSSNEALMKRICGKDLNTIYEDVGCRVQVGTMSKNFVNTTDQFMKGLAYYQDKIDPTIKIELLSD